MEENKWKNIFENAIQHQGINHVWRFHMVEHPQTQQDYLEYTEDTFARFQCSSCLREWNSMKVHIKFLIKKSRRCGTVIMEISRQECRFRNDSILHLPEVTKENKKRVMSNLVNKIQNMIYGQNYSNPPLSPKIYSDHVKGPHDKKHCETCKIEMNPWHEGHKEKEMFVKPQSVKLSSSSSIKAGHKKIPCIITIIIVIIVMLYILYMYNV